MKRILSLLLVVIFVMSMFSGCGNDADKTEETNTDTEAGSVIDYLAPKADTLYSFVGTGSEYADWKISYDFINEAENYYQRRLEVGDSCVVEALKNVDGMLKMGFSDPSGRYFYNLKDITDYQNTVVLKEPIEVGTKWQRSSDEISGTVYAEITDVNKEIEIPYGKVNALEVRLYQEGADDETYSAYEYYVKGIGFVKQSYTSGEELIMTELESITENFTYTREVTFCYPIASDNDFIYENEVRTISYPTNCNPLEILKSELQKVGATATRGLIDAETAINSFIIDPYNSIARIDLSADYVTGMNAGVQAESMLVQSLVNSLISFSGMTKIAVNIDGGGYESGHLLIGKHEYQTYDNPQAEAEAELEEAE